MKYRKLDEHSDYTLGRNEFLSGREAVGQAIITRLRLLYSEWWEDIEDGLPLFERILGSYGGDDMRQAVDLIVSERILKTKDVTEIRGFDSTFTNRRYEAYCIVKTAYGDITLDASDNFKTMEVKY